MTLFRRFSSGEKRNSKQPTTRILKQKQIKSKDKKPSSSFFLFLIFSLVAFYWLNVSGITLLNQEYATFVNSYTTKPSSNFQDLSNCTISFVPPSPRKESEWRKPLWIPSFPASGSASPSNQGDLVKELIDKLTGSSSAVKNYHMSVRKRLKRCRGISETVGCSNAHPYVPVGPEKQQENFQSPVIFVLRNPATAFPASYTDKGIAYRNLKGQSDENEWRKIRDEYLEGTIKVWKQMINWWMEADYYKIAIFLPYEQLVDPRTGIRLLSQLANVLRESGFDVAPTSDLPCIWYQVATKEWERQKELTRYVSGYTKPQKNFILKELEEFIKHLSSQKEKEDQLISILKEYLSQVQKDTRLDIPWTNNSIS